MLVSVFFYTYIIHLLIDALFLVHKMLTKPFNFYVERISTLFFDGSVHFLIRSKIENKMSRFCLLIRRPLLSFWRLFAVFILTPLIEGSSISNGNFCVFRQAVRIPVGIS